MCTDKHPGFHPTTWAAQHTCLHHSPTPAQATSFPFSRNCEHYASYPGSLTAPCIVWAGWPASSHSCPFAPCRPPLHNTGSTVCTSLGCTHHSPAVRAVQFLSLLHRQLGQSSSLPATGEDQQGRGRGRGRERRGRRVAVGWEPMGHRPNFQGLYMVCGSQVGELWFKILLSIPDLLHANQKTSHQMSFLTHSV